MEQSINAIEGFLEHVIYTEQWRLVKAQEYPDDSRYHNATQALAHLYNYVRKGTDPLVVELANLLESVRRDPEAWLVFANEMPPYLGRFGLVESLSCSEEDLDFVCAEFLERMVAMSKSILWSITEDEA